MPERGVAPALLAGEAVDGAAVAVHVEAEHALLQRRRLVAVRVLVRVLRLRGCGGQA
jgi:hypothetical protein